MPREPPRGEEALQRAPSPAMAADPDATSIQPAGLARTLLGVALVFPLPTAVVIGLRCWVRIRHKVFGVDDGLMLFGWVSRRATVSWFQGKLTWGLFQMLSMGVIGIVARSTYAGVGTRDAHLNAYLQSDGRKYLWFFQVTYCCSLLFIKGSICVFLLRIAVVRAHRIILWATLTFATLSTTVVIIGLFIICDPIAAAWGHPGKCKPTIVIASLGYLVSTGAVVTDWICAILPVFMLYKTNMKTTTKISLSVILGLAILASMATIIRLPYVKYYTLPDDYLYHCSNIVLWSIFESGIGIIACSLPALKKLLKVRGHTASSSNQSPAQRTPDSGPNRATATSRTTTGSRGMYKSTGSSTLADEEREHIEVAPSNRRIHVQVDVEMQSLERPTTAHTSHGSIEELVVHRQ